MIIKVIIHNKKHTYKYAVSRTDRRQERGWGEGDSCTPHISGRPQPGNIRYQHNEYNVQYSTKTYIIFQYYINKREACCLKKQIVLCDKFT